jgi:DNA-binding winged helix-turn-helix (wHTH) protein
MSTEPAAITSPEANASGMMAPQFPARYARFGTFQADLERKELFQAGQRVKVQAKVFQSLQLLLGRPGEIVTREEARQHLWPDTSLTNLDANVNTTMNKLRQVLGDSPESPVYVETIPRRGYSFVARVEFSNIPAVPLEAPTNTVLKSTSQAAASAASRLRTRADIVLRATSLLLAGMILGALLAFVWFFAQGRNQRVGNRAKVSATLSIPGLQRILRS